MGLGNKYAFTDEKTMLSSKGISLDVVGCPKSVLFSMFRLPLFGGLKNQNSAGLLLSMRVSWNACITYANRTGEALSPCCTSVL
jgi:hypothetical protein